MFRVLAGMALALLIGGAAAQAKTTVYNLHDHGYGAEGPNYGLRFDELSGNNSVVTFSASTNGASLKLYYDDMLMKAKIIGKVWFNGGGGGLYDVVYHMTGLTKVGDGFKALGGYGSISGPGLSGPVDYWGKQDKSGYATNFLFNGHRLPGDDTTPVLEGWIYADDKDRPCCSDWLVKASLAPVPVPASLPMIGGGLALLGAVGYRRRRKA